MVTPTKVQPVGLGRRLARWFPVFAVGTLLALVIGGRFYQARFGKTAANDHREHAASVSSTVTGVKVGETVPDFALVDLDNRVRRLSGFAGKPVVLVTVGLKCPCVASYRERLNGLAAAYGARGVAFLGFNSNANETHEQVLADRTVHPFDFPIGCDNRQAIADLLGATHMTEAFLIDGQGVLRYRGRIDDNTYHPKDVTRPDLKTALDDLLAGRPISVVTAPAIGCAIVREIPGEAP